jgi:predicted metalloprotease with PDZ domain
MSTTRPGDIPALDSGGWPAFVQNLEVSDQNGRPIATTSEGAKGWRLATRSTDRLTLRYEVDYSVLAERRWPAQREAVFADDTHLVVVGRSLFITTGAVGTSRVTFHLPRPWLAITPWERKSATTFLAPDPAELVDNLIVLSRSRPDVVAAADFRVSITAFGHWQPVRNEVRRVFRAVIPELVRLMEFKERQNYVVVLLPTLERGGESFRGSFALTVDTPPSGGNSAEWGNTIAHEVFHYWNGWHLRGSDYAASQWFQEGFTEYGANISMLASGLVDEQAFRQKLSQHVARYANLKTTLEAPGTRKGPPLYSGGALVAFMWDVMIRQASGGKRTIADFYRALWRSTDEGRLAYDWPRIQSALDATARQDWAGFHQRYIAGNERLPLETTLPLAGLRLTSSEDGSPHVIVDPSAPPAARSLWKEMIAHAIR